MKSTTEQAYSSLPVANQNEARDLNSRRASSFLEDQDHRYDPGVAQDLAYWGSRVDPGGILEHHDFLTTSRGSGPTSPKPAARRGFFRT